MKCCACVGGGGMLFVCIRWSTVWTVTSWHMLMNVLHPDKSQLFHFLKVKTSDLWLAHNPSVSVCVRWPQNTDCNNYRIPPRQHTDCTQQLKRWHHLLRFLCSETRFGHRVRQVLRMHAQMRMHTHLPNDTRDRHSRRTLFSCGI